MSQTERIDRRLFATQLAVGACTFTAGVASNSNVASADQRPEVNESGDKKPAEPEPKPEPVPPEILLLSFLTRQYPSDHFDEVAIQGIFRDIRGDVIRGRQLSEFAHKNADEPAFVFVAYRDQDQDGEQK